VTAIIWLDAAEKDVYDRGQRYFLFPGNGARVRVAS